MAFSEHLLSLSFKDTPDYKYLTTLLHHVLADNGFDPAISPIIRPIRRKYNANSHVELGSRDHLMIWKGRISNITQGCEGELKFITKALDEAYSVDNFMRLDLEPDLEDLIHDTLYGK